MAIVVCWSVHHKLKYLDNCCIDNHDHWNIYPWFPEDESKGLWRFPDIYSGTAMKFTFVVSEITQNVLDGLTWNLVLMFMFTSGWIVVTLVSLRLSHWCHHRSKFLFVFYDQIPAVTINPLIILVWNLWLGTHPKPHFKTDFKYTKGQPHTPNNNLIYHWCMW